MGIVNWLTGKKKESKQSVRKPLLLFNTRTAAKEPFIPLSAGQVRMYNCGPTVYDYQHIGNLRPYVFTDVLRRVLRLNGYGVQQVINITDVGHLTGDNEGDADSGEDKMEKGARAFGKSARALAEEITEAFWADLDALNVKRDGIKWTKATNYIQEQIALVQTLEEKGYTYKISDGVYFDTSKFPAYGKLGNIDVGKLREGARIEINPEKKSPADFALWKLTPEDVIRQQEWDSPWGRGFPGWHLECTAMIFAELGKQIDIHTGGVDHIPVHHNNEIAQAEAATARSPFATYWLHSAFITIDGQKISKSIGNTILLRGLKDRGIHPLAFRYWLLSGHYRSPMNFTWEALEGAQKAFSRLIRLFVEELGGKNGKVIPTYRKRFHEAINDDLDTPATLALLWELVRDESNKKPDTRATLLEFDKVLGLGLLEGNKKLSDMLAGLEKKVTVTEAPTDIQALVEKRERARREKNWARADEIRTELESRGYTVTDTDEGTILNEK